MFAAGQREEKGWAANMRSEAAANMPILNDFDLYPTQSSPSVFSLPVGVCEQQGLVCNRLEDLVCVHVLSIA